ncbi:MAG: hypothetical protein KatS3mg087_1642 [Patescibacteria group bacterium]|nr:MAG: hypothetical protein KatS3mg087_1642 [Patescibacteria group bacterium]
MIGKKIQKLRENAGLTRTALARQLTELSGKVHSNTQIQNWEEGINLPSISKLQLLAKYFNVQLDYFIEEVNHE